MYFVGNVRASWKGTDEPAKFVRFLLLFPLFLCLSMGLSLHNAWAVLEGFWGKRSEFVRTPKFNLDQSGAGVAANVYRRRSLNWITIAEGILALVFAVACVWGLWTGHNFFVAFHLMLAAGYGSIFGLTLAHSRLRTSSLAASAVPATVTAPLPPEPLSRQEVTSVG